MRSELQKPKLEIKDTLFIPTIIYPNTFHNVSTLQAWYFIQLDSIDTVNIISRFAGLVFHYETDQLDAPENDIWSSVVDN